MSSTIVFFSDFGLKDPYVAQVKAVINRICPGIQVIDLTHMIDSFCIECGAYVLDSSINWFPVETVFLGVIDPGVGSERKPVIIRGLSRWFVGPDNGLFTPVILNDKEAKAWVIKTWALPFKEISSTFHGRDIFGPVAALLSCKEDPYNIGDEISIDSLVKKDLLWSLKENSSICFKVIYIDKYGNIVFSTKDPLNVPIGKELIITSSHKSWRGFYVSSFSHVNEGEIAIYINSFGYLELAVNRGDASKHLQVSIGDKLCLTPA